MKLYASGEDYLETLLVLQQKHGMVRSVDVARHMEVSKPSVCHAVAVLQEGGFLSNIKNCIKTSSLMGAILWGFLYDMTGGCGNVSGTVMYPGTRCVSSAWNMEFCARWKRCIIKSRLPRAVPMRKTI